MWKCAQAGLAERATVFCQAPAVIGKTPADDLLESFPHIHNAFIEASASACQPISPPPRISMIAPRRLAAYT